MKQGIFIIGLVCSISLFGQVASDEEIREKFAFEIIHIDEFMERFNFDESTKLLEYLRKENGEVESIDRKFLLKKLIKVEDPMKQVYLVDEFINFVTDTVSPYYLYYSDKDWYAELHCTFIYQSDKIPVTLILAPHVNADSSSKWVIKSVLSERLGRNLSMDTTRIISPVSHNTDFAGLHNCLVDTKNLLNYFDEGFSPDQKTCFYTLLRLNKLKLEEIKEVRYHFLQIPKWTFRVEYINVKDLQSGWLITDLSRVTWKEKDLYRKDNLNL